MTLENKPAETKTVWVAYTNSDLTEGRGAQIPLAICELKSTAIRLGAREYVMGTNCPVYPTELVKVDGKWYAPRGLIQVLPPTDADVKAQAEYDAAEDAVGKALALGLTPEEIAAIRGS